MSMFRLVPMQPDGSPAELIPALPDFTREAIAITVELYRRVGYVRPWVSYFEVLDDVCVGLCAFKSPPIDSTVEIAYWTFSDFEGRGVATQAARQLVALAHATDPNMQVIAQTLPELNASGALLKKVGFLLEGCVDHSEDGTVWQWRYHGSPAT
jgi:ribosomal-protein-alanine N-acetyltransferase